MLEKITLHKIQDIESYLQQHPSDEVALEVFSDVQLELEQLTMDVLERHKDEMATLWFKYVDRCSKQFFTSHKPRQKKDNIHSLQVGTQLVTNQSTKYKVITDFYRALYVADRHSDRVHESREKVWKHALKVITQCGSGRMINLQILLAPGRFTKQ